MRGAAVLAVAYLLGGAAAVVAGVVVLFGVGWGLVAAGGLLLVLGVLEVRGEAPAAPPVELDARRPAA